MMPLLYMVVTSIKHCESSVTSTLVMGKSGGCTNCGRLPGLSFLKDWARSLPIRVCERALSLGVCIDPN